MEKDVIPGLIDPERVPDVFAEGFASIEKIGGSCVRFTLYSTRDFGDGQFDRVVVARVVVPTDALSILFRQTKAVVDGHPFMHTAELSDDTVH